MQRRQFWLNTCNQSFTSPVELKGLNIGPSDQGSELECQIPFRSKRLVVSEYTVSKSLYYLYHKWLSSKALQRKPSAYLSILTHLAKCEQFADLGDRFEPCLSSCLLTLQQNSLFSKACAIVLASTCIRTVGTLLCNATCQPAVVIDRSLISTSRVILPTWLFCGSCMLSGGW